MLSAQPHWSLAALGHRCDEDIDRNAILWGLLDDYQGQLRLMDSAMGGLRIDLFLPAAQRALSSDARRVDID